MLPVTCDVLFEPVQEKEEPVQEKEKPMVEQLAQELICPICLDILQDPMAMPCMHSICAHCMCDGWVHDNAMKTCPICRTSTNDEYAPNHTLGSIVGIFLKANPEYQRSADEIKRREDKVNAVFKLLESYGCKEARGWIHSA